MKSNPGWIAAAGLLVLSFFLPAHTQTSDAEIEFGIAAYKNSHYEEAIDHFQKAVDRDSTNTRARMYLANALQTQFIPGVETEDNNRFADHAIAEYEYILSSGAEREPRINSAKGIAYLYLNMKKWDDARKYYQIASGLDPKDPEPHYSIGVLDWTVSYQPRTEARLRLGMKPEENLSAKIPAQKELCDELRVKNLTTIEEGIDNLNKAIELRPDYDDAMAYMNLTYRERADLECDDPASRARDLKSADDWVDKTLLVKKQKAEKNEIPPHPATNLR